MRRTSLSVRLLSVLMSALLALMPMVPALVVLTVPTAPANAFDINACWATVKDGWKTTVVAGENMTAIQADIAEAAAKAGEAGACVSEGSSNPAMAAITLALIALRIAGEFSGADQCNAMVNNAIGKMIAEMLIESGLAGLVDQLMPGASTAIAAIAGGTATEALTQAIPPLGHMVGCGCAIAGLADDEAKLGKDAYDKLKEVYDQAKKTIEDAENCSETIAWVADKFDKAVDWVENAGAWFRDQVSAHGAPPTCPPPVQVDKDKVCTQELVPLSAGVVLDATWAAQHNGEQIACDPWSDYGGSAAGYGAYCVCPEGTTAQQVVQADGTYINKCACPYGERLENGSCSRICPVGQVWNGPHGNKQGVGLCVDECDAGSTRGDFYCEPKCGEESIWVEANTKPGDGGQATGGSCEVCPDNTQAKHANYSPASAGYPASGSSMGSCEPCKQGEVWDPASRMCGDRCHFWTVENFAGSCMPICGPTEVLVLTREVGNEGVCSTCPDGMVAEDNTCKSCAEGATLVEEDGFGGKTKVCKCPEGQGNKDGVCVPCAADYVSAPAEMQGQDPQGAACVYCPNCNAPPRLAQCEVNSVPDPKDPYNSCVPCESGTKRVGNICIFSGRIADIPHLNGTAVGTAATAAAAAAAGVIILGRAASPSAPDCPPGQLRADGTCLSGSTLTPINCPPGYVQSGRYCVATAKARPNQRDGTPTKASVPDGVGVLPNRNPSLTGTEAKAKGPDGPDDSARRPGPPGKKSGPFTGQAVGVQPGDSNPQGNGALTGKAATAKDVGSNSTKPKALKGNTALSNQAGKKNRGPNIQGGSNTAGTPPANTQSSAPAFKAPSAPQLSQPSTRIQRLPPPVINAPPPPALRLPPPGGGIGSRPLIK